MSRSNKGKAVLVSDKRDVSYAEKSTLVLMKPVHEQVGALERVVSRHNRKVVLRQEHRSIEETALSLSRRYASAGKAVGQPS